MALGRDDARLVRLEIPPMMRYCAGTCPCTWLTAMALPNVIYCYKIWKKCVKGKQCNQEVYYDTTTSGSNEQEEIFFLKCLIPAQTAMGLSSYFAWYYGYGFYGPVKSALILYAVTLGVHTSCHLTDVPQTRTAVVHRSVAAGGTLLCAIWFLRFSKLAFVLMLPVCGVYTYLAVLSTDGRDENDTRNQPRGPSGDRARRQTSGVRPTAGDGDTADADYADYGDYGDYGEGEGFDGDGDGEPVDDGNNNNRNTNRKKLRLKKRKRSSILRKAHKPRRKTNYVSFKEQVEFQCSSPEQSLSASLSSSEVSENDPCQ